MNRQVPKNRFTPIFLITLCNEITITIGFPILTFLCFDPSSTLFVASVSNTIRSFWFGILSSLPNFAAIIAYPLLGFLSDRCGRKPILIVGIVSSFLLCVLTTLSIFYGLMALLLIGSIIAGFCSRTMPITIAAIADISEDQHKIVNMGYLQFFVSIGAFIGPILGGYFAQRFFFQELNFSMPYLIGMIIAMFTGVFAVKYFGESYKIVNCEKIVWKIFFNAKVLQISIILIFSQISWRIYYLFIPPVLQMHFHYSATVVGLFLGLIALWLAIASLFCVRWLNYYLTIEKIIKYSCYVELIGLFMSIIGSTCSLGIFSQYLVWGSAIPVAMSDVVIFCALTALYSQAASEHNQGKIMGLCFFITALVWGLVGFIGGTIMRINIALPLWCAPLGLIILFILPFFRSLDKKHL